MSFKLSLICSIAVLISMSDGIKSPSNITGSLPNITADCVPFGDGKLCHDMHHEQINEFCVGLVFDTNSRQADIRYAKHLSDSLSRDKIHHSSLFTYAVCSATRSVIWMEMIEEGENKMADYHLHELECDKAAGSLSMQRLNHIDVHYPNKPGFVIIFDSTGNEIDGQVQDIRMITTTHNGSMISVKFKGSCKTSIPKKSRILLDLTGLTEFDRFKPDLTQLDELVDGIEKRNLGLTKEEIIDLAERVEVDDLAMGVVRGIIHKVRKLERFDPVANHKKSPYKLSDFWGEKPIRRNHFETILNKLSDDGAVAFSGNSISSVLSLKWVIAMKRPTLFLPAMAFISVLKEVSSRPLITTDVNDWSISNKIILIVAALFLLKGTLDWLIKNACKATFSLAPSLISFNILRLTFMAALFLLIIIPSVPAESYDLFETQILDKPRYSEDYLISRGDNTNGFRVIKMDDDAYKEFMGANETQRICSFSKGFRYNIKMNECTYVLDSVMRSSGDHKSDMCHSEIYEKESYPKTYKRKKPEPFIGQLNLDDEYKITNLRWPILDACKYAQLSEEFETDERVSCKTDFYLIAASSDIMDRLFNDGIIDKLTNESRLFIFSTSCDGKAVPHTARLTTNLQTVFGKARKEVEYMCPLIKDECITLEEYGFPFDYNGRSMRVAPSSVEDFKQKPEIGGISFMFSSPAYVKVNITSHSSGNVLEHSGWFKGRSLKFPVLKNKCYKAACSVTVGNGITGIEYQMNTYSCPYPDHWNLMCKLPDWLQDSIIYVYKHKILYYSCILVFIALLMWYCVALLSLLNAVISFCVGVIFFILIRCIMCSLLKCCGAKVDYPSKNNFVSSITAYYYLVTNQYSNYMYWSVKSTEDKEAIKLMDILESAEIDVTKKGKIDSIFPSAVITKALILSNSTKTICSDKHEDISKDIDKMILIVDLLYSRSFIMGFITTCLSDGLNELRQTLRLLKAFDLTSKRSIETTIEMTDEWFKRSLDMGSYLSFRIIRELKTTHQSFKSLSDRIIARSGSESFASHGLLDVTAVEDFIQRATHTDFCIMLSSMIETLEIVSRDSLTIRLDNTRLKDFLSIGPAKLMDCKKIARKCLTNLKSLGYLSPNYVKMVRMAKKVLDPKNCDDWYKLRPHLNRLHTILRHCKLSDTIYISDYDFNRCRLILNAMGSAMSSSNDGTVGSDKLKSIILDDILVMSDNPDDIDVSELLHSLTIQNSSDIDALNKIYTYMLSRPRPDPSSLTRESMIETLNLARRMPVNLMPNVGALGSAVFSTMSLPTLLGFMKSVPKRTLGLLILMTQIQNGFSHPFYSDPHLISNDTLAVLGLVFTMAFTLTALIFFVWASLMCIITASKCVDKKLWRFLDVMKSLATNPMILVPATIASGGDKTKCDAQPLYNEDETNEAYYSYQSKKEESTLTVMDKLTIMNAVIIAYVAFIATLIICQICRDRWREGKKSGEYSKFLNEGLLMQPTTESMKNHLKLPDKVDRGSGSVIVPTLTSIKVMILCSLCCLITSSEATTKLPRDKFVLSGPNSQSIHSTLEEIADFSHNGISLTNVKLDYFAEDFTVMRGLTGVCKTFFPYQPDLLRYSMTPDAHSEILLEPSSEIKSAEGVTFLMHPTRTHVAGLRIIEKATKKVISQMLGEVQYVYEVSKSVMRVEGQSNIYFSSDEGYEGLAAVNGFGKDSWSQSSDFGGSCLTNWADVDGVRTGVLVRFSQDKSSLYAPKLVAFDNAGSMKKLPSDFSSTNNMRVKSGKWTEGCSLINDYFSEASNYHATLLQHPNSSLLISVYSATLPESTAITLLDEDGYTTPVNPCSAPAAKDCEHFIDPLPYPSVFGNVLSHPENEDSILFQPANYPRVTVEVLWEAHGAFDRSKTVDYFKDRAHTFIINKRALSLFSVFYNTRDGIASFKAKHGDPIEPPPVTLTQSVIERFTQFKDQLKLNPVGEEDVTIIINMSPRSPDASEADKMEIIITLNELAFVMDLVAESPCEDKRFGIKRIGRSTFMYRCFLPDEGSAITLKFGSFEKKFFLHPLTGVAKSFQKKDELSYFNQISNSLPVSYKSLIIAASVTGTVLLLIIIAVMARCLKGKCKGAKKLVRKVKRSRVNRYFKGKFSRKRKQVSSISDEERRKMFSDSEEGSGGSDSEGSGDTFRTRKDASKLM